MKNKFVWLRGLVSLAILIGLALVIDLGEVGRILKRASWPLLPLVLAANTAAYLIVALRWGHLCRRLGLVESFGHYVRGIYLFQVTSQVVPSLLGELSRIAVFPRGTDKITIIKSIALDRLANQISLVLWITLALPWYWSQPFPTGMKWLLCLPTVAGLIAIAVAFAYRRRARSRTDDASRSWLDRLRFLGVLFRDRGGVYPVSLGLGLSFVLGLEFWFAAITLPLSSEVEAVPLILLVPLATFLITLAPISFADWGTRELMAVAILVPAGLRAEDVIAISLLIGVANLLCSLPGLLFAWPSVKGSGPGRSRR